MQRQQLGTIINSRPATAGTLGERGRGGPSAQVSTLSIIGAIKLSPSQKRIKDRKEKVKGSWHETCIQYTRLHLLTFCWPREESLCCGWKQNQFWQEMIIWNRYDASSFWRPSEVCVILPPLSQWRGNADLASRSKQKQKTLAVRLTEIYPTCGMNSKVASKHMWDEF